MTTTSPPPPVSSHRSASRVPVERLWDYLERRRRSGVPFSAGEVVTLVVGVLRGAGDGEWWLTATGRPLVVASESGVVPVADVWKGIAPLCPEPLSELLDALRDATSSGVSLDAVPWERAFFAAAPPSPLILGPLPPRDDDAPDPEEDVPPPWLALIDAELGEAFREIAADLRRRWGRRRAARGVRGRRASSEVVAGRGVEGRGVEGRGVAAGRRVALVAAAAAAATVAAVVLLLPSPDGAGRSTSETPAASTRVDPLETTGPGDEPEDGELREGATDHTASNGAYPRGMERGETAQDPTTTDDPVGAAADLLTAYARCAGDAPCVRALREAPPAPGEPQPLDPASGQLSLIDDFGGVAVVHIESGSDRQYVTIVRSDDRWLVRAAGAIADQPS